MPQFNKELAAIDHEIILNQNNIADYEGLADEAQAKIARLELQREAYRAADDAFCGVYEKRIRERDNDAQQR